MNVVEFEIFRFPVPSDQIDHHIWVFDRLANGIHVIQIVKMEQHLSQITDQFQTIHFRMITAIGKQALWPNFTEFIGNITSNESGTTEYCDNHAIETGTSTSASFQWW